MGYTQSHGTPATRGPVIYDPAQLWPSADTPSDRRTDRHGAMVPLRIAARPRHPLRLRLFGTLPRELRDPSLWRQAALFIPVTIALIVAALAVTP